MPLAPRDLDYFLEVARHEQLAQAASNLDVTAAALSKAIRRLEDEIGLRLFDRAGTGMTLTPFGHTFRERAQRIKAEHDDALRHAGDVRAGRAGLLRVGATFAVMDTVIAPALATLQPRRPSLHAVLTVGNSDDLLERARRGSLDAAVVPTYEHLPLGLDRVELGTDELVVVLRDGHPLVKRRKLDMGELAACAWILPQRTTAARALLDAAFHSGGVAPPQGVVEVDANASWSLSLVAATDLLSLVPRSALRTRGSQGVRVLEFEPLRLARTISLFSRPGVYRSPLMAEFTQAMRAAAQLGER